MAKDYYEVYGFTSPSEHATLLQRLPNVVQTPWTFGQRWVNVVLVSRVHLASIQWGSDGDACFATS